MKLLRSTLYMLLLILASACTTTLSTTSSKSVKEVSLKSQQKSLFQQQSGKIYFTILQLNDVYEIAPIQGGKYGGMARVESLHKELLTENPNTLLVLAGDFLNPSLLGTLKVDGERIRGKQMIEVMNAMNFDLVVFGNHEFDLSYEQLQGRINESKFDWISSNVFHNLGGKNHYFHKVQEGKKEALHDSYIQEFYKNGKAFKVGFITACIDSNPRSYVSYSNALVEIERSYNEIKDKVDLVIGLTHLQIEKDREVAKLLPNVPLIMGGHEHTNNYEDIDGVKIAKADANAKTVYIHRFEYDPVTKKVNLKSELRTIDSSIPEDTEVKQVVNKWQNILNMKVTEVVDSPYKIIYKTVEPLDARDTPIRSVQTNMGNIIAKSMSYAYNDEVDCSFVNGGSVRIDDVLKGEINSVDIFRVLPYGGSVLKVKLKGSLLKEVLDFGLRASGKGAYLQHYKISQNSDKQWLINNQLIHSEKIYTIATTDYLLKGFDIPVLKETNPNVISVYKPKTNELAEDIRRAVIKFLQNQ
ncbi:bifunctional metallophosphatase/5'-nucleotidase [Tenacibaculum sp. IB213877]|uniref:bifunctional metallophosphatase/5'-nucleotidase n=1 Tax=Tenacibaculum sp. IB213877 TaxID=3097351 RepID=UPI002A59E24B|nr:bifunctional metallophosphatase/5'-nucleotidase [Tenacibaculum sp. IB213877]MDY0779703.1 bifunctional metallophosphatase/5'-nucleotidase [Tenacibaculum sp. IB213877]